MVDGGQEEPRARPGRDARCPARRSAAGARSPSRCLSAGWSPGADRAAARVTGAAVLLLPFALWRLRGQWRRPPRAAPASSSLRHRRRRRGPGRLLLGRVQRLDVGIALLSSTSGIVLVVLWVWARTHQRPHRLTVARRRAGPVGLALVLDVTGQSTPPLSGVLWGLVAAAGLAGHYVLAARPTAIPSTAFAGLGMGVGAVALARARAVGVLPMDVGRPTVQVAGAGIPAWLALGELVVVAAAAHTCSGSRLPGCWARRVASFVGLTEVLFAVLFAWLLLGELPGVRAARRRRRAASRASWRCASASCAWPARPVPGRPQRTTGFRVPRSVA